MDNFVLNVNGQDRHVAAPPDETLLSVLRNRIGLTGTKYGCGEGECAACTVLVDGEPTPSCQVAVSSVKRARIVTIEGLESNGRLSPVQQAFLDEQALQCGYCTAGMVLASTALLQEHPHPSETQIAEFMNGHICRCGTYPRIVAAIQRAANHPEGRA